MNPWIVLVILILLYPVVMYLANKNIDKQRKKQEEYYKKREAEREEGFKKMYTMKEVSDNSD